MPKPSPPFDLIVADLDGTLVQRDLTVCPQDLAALRRARRFQAGFTIATGRIMRAAERYIEQAEITLPVILYNGAVILDPQRREVFFERRIAVDQARLALGMLRKYPLDAQLYLHPQDQGYYVEKITPNVEAFSAKDGIPPILKKDLLTFLQEGPLKLLLIGPQAALLRYQAEVRQAELDLGTVLSERNFLELLPPGVSKGAALQRLCQRLSIPLERVIAFGDNLNDAEMLQSAGMGVAMASGAPALHAFADGVASCVAEGLGEYFFPA